MPSRLTSPGVIVAVGGDDGDDDGGDDGGNDGDDDGGDDGDDSGGDGGVRHCYYFQKRAYYEYESPRIAMIITALVRTNSTASGQQSSYDVHLFGKRGRDRER